MNYNISVTLIMSLIKLLTSRKIEEIAKDIGFTERIRGLTATTFFQAFTIGAWELHDVTLGSLAAKCCELQYGIKLSRQALFKRLKLGAELLKRLLETAMAFATMHSVSTERIMVLKQFRNIYICDSTSISLPDKLVKLWPGLGGTNAAAAVKIQVIFDIIQRRFRKIEITSAKGNDSKYTHNIADMLRFMDLVIFDLGFFCIKSFKEIIEKGAFFVSRVKTNTVFYVQSLEKNGGFDKIEISKILKRSNGVVDQILYIGGHESNRTAVRLVAVRLPEDKINERRRKAKKKAKACGKTLSKYESNLLAWNIIITNVDEDILSVETICELYRIRWQIELIFKSWKGCFNIDQIGNVGEKYLECLLYGRLIIITLMTTLYSQAYYITFWSYGRGVSAIRFFKLLREKIGIVSKNIIHRVKNAEVILLALEDVIGRSIEECRKRRTTERTLMEHDLPIKILQMLG